MRYFKEKIADNSLWITLTPSAAAKELPFYSTEIGHFYASEFYLVKRDFHDSCLFLYTVGGVGSVSVKGETIALSPKTACVIDCRTEHEYKAISGKWEFLWFHFGGTAAFSTARLLNSGGLKAFTADTNVISEGYAALIEAAESPLLSAALECSLQIHQIINYLYQANASPSAANDCVGEAVSFIEENYASAITLDDILERVHISRYHFIRLFHKAMNVSPYNYIVLYRVNRAKIMLRTTDRTVAEVAELNGFSDSSSFIALFKRSTGETPLKYRKSFAQLSSYV